MRVKNWTAAFLAAVILLPGFSQTALSQVAGERTMPRAVQRTSGEFSPEGFRSSEFSFSTTSEVTTSHAPTHISTESAPSPTSIAAPAPLSVPGIVQTPADTIVPGGTMIIDFGNNPTWNIAGNLNNFGTILAISTNPDVSTATIAAQNIYNQIGGSISTVLPAGGIPGAISNLNLVLQAAENVINFGTISSSANLSVVAGGTIVNALPASSAGQLPVMQAATNINLSSGIGQIINAGTISSAAGNINVSAALSNLHLQNVGGTLEALSGSINIRDSLFTGKLHTYILGGDIFTTELNIFSGNGSVLIDVNELTGKINVSSHELSVAASSPVVELGNIEVNGDPIVTNDSGDVIILPQEGSNIFSTNGGPLSIFASRNIISLAEGIFTQGATGAGTILMQAGGSIDLSATRLIETRSPSNATTGGGIFLTAGQAISLGTWSNPNTVNSGGPVTLVAGTAISFGDINTPNNGISIRTNGDVVQYGTVLSTQASSQLPRVGPVVIQANSIILGAQDNPATINASGTIQLESATSAYVGNLLSNGFDVAVFTGGDFSQYENPNGTKISTQGTNRSGSVIIDAGGAVNLDTTQITTVTTTGNGGAVFMTATGPIVVGDAVSSDNFIYMETLGYLSTQSLSTVGKSIVLRALNNISTKSLTTSGVTRAGAVDIQSNLSGSSSSAFVIGGSGQSNGVNGNINVASAQAFSGDVPFVSIRNGGTGGITVENGDAINVSADGGAKTAAIALDAGSGRITLKGGPLEASALSGSSAAGAVFLKGSSIVTSGNMTIEADGHSGALAGPVITSAERIEYNGDLTISADGSGGLVRVVPKDSMTIQTFFDGSTHRLSVGVMPAAGSVTFQSTGQGNLTLRADSPDGTGTVDAYVPQTLSFNGNRTTLRANGINGGSGGTVYINAGQLATTGQASLVADGNLQGTGGNVGVELGPIGDVRLGNSAGQFSISADGGSSGSGGFALVEVGRNVSVDGVGGSAVTANGNGDGDGGFVAVQAGQSSIGGYSFTNNAVLQANGSGTGKGGTVAVASLGNLDFSVGAGTTQLKLQAEGGSAGAGGVVLLENTRGITVAGDAISVKSGTNGDGGTILLFAGESGTGNLNISGNFLADGNGTGIGGFIDAEAPVINITGNTKLSANGGSNAVGGEIVLNSFGRGAALSIGSSTTSSQISATGGLGGGRVFLYADGNINVSANSSINVSAVSDGSGGIAELVAGTNGFTGGVSVSGRITANGGSSEGSGGVVNLFFNQIPTSSNPLPTGLVIGGTVQADALSTSEGGSVNAFNVSGGPLVVSVTGLLSADSAGTQKGSLVFIQEGQPVRITGGLLSGSLRGFVDAVGSSVTIDGLGPNNTLLLRFAVATAGDVLIHNDNFGSRIAIQEIGLILAQANPLTGTGGNITISSNAIDVGTPVFFDTFALVANNISITTTAASSGNILLDANIFATDTVHLTVHGLGNISQGDGLIDPEFVFLNGDIGLQGSENNPVRISADNLTVKSAGDVFVQQVDEEGTINRPLNLLGVQAKSFSLTAVGDVRIKGQLLTTTGNQTVDSDKSIFIEALSWAPNGTISLIAEDNIFDVRVAVGESLRARTVRLTTTNGDVGSLLNPIRTVAPSLSVHSGNDAFIQNFNHVDILGSDAKGEFSLTTISREIPGEIIVKGTLHANKISMTADEDANIEIDTVSISAEDSIELRVSGTGHISQTAIVSLVTAPRLKFETEFGNVSRLLRVTNPDGTTEIQFLPMSISTNELAVLSGGQALFHNLGSNQILVRDSAAAVFLLQSFADIRISNLVGGIVGVTGNGSLTVESQTSVSAVLGSVLLRSEGPLTLGENSFVGSLGGNVLIGSKESITLEKGAKITAFTPLGNDTGNGNVILLAGQETELSLAEAIVDGEEILFSPLGTVFWGPNKVNAKSPANSATGLNRLVLLYGTGSINLNGSTFIFASAPSAESGPGASQFAPGKTSDSNHGQTSNPPPGPSGQDPPGWNNNPGLTGAVPPGLQWLQNRPDPKRLQSGDSQFADPLVYSEEPKEEYKNVAFIHPSCGSVSDVLTLREPVHSFSHDYGLFYYADEADFSLTRTGVVVLKHGEIVLRARKKGLIRIGKLAVAVDKNCILLIMKSGNRATIWNLYDRHAGSVQCTLDGQQICSLCPGEQFDYVDGHSPSSHNVSARRRILRRPLPDSGFIEHSEYSLISLLNGNTLLSRVAKLAEPSPLKADILKMAACVMMRSGRSQERFSK